MSTQGDLEIFERAVGSGGRLLKVEGDRVGSKLGLLVLTFDIGRILVTADGAANGAANGVADGAANDAANGAAHDLADGVADDGATDEATDDGATEERSTDGATLRVRHVVERAALPPGLVSLQEEEPWWRLLGHPLTAVWPGDVEWGTGARSLGPSTILKLRFREESQNPRVITLAAVGGVVAVTLVGA